MCLQACVHVCVCVCACMCVNVCVCMQIQEPVHRHSPLGVGFALPSACALPCLGKNFSNPFGIFWLSAVHPRIREPKVSGTDCRLSKCMALCICIIKIINYHDNNNNNKSWTSKYLLIMLQSPSPYLQQKKSTHIQTDMRQTQTHKHTCMHIQNLTSVYIKDKPSKGRSQRSKITSSVFFL